MIEFSNLNFIDWIMLSLILTTSLIGLNNGFIKEFLNFFIWTLSILFSLLVISKLIFANLIDQNIIYRMIIFFIIVLISFIILKLIFYYLVGDLKNMINDNFNFINYIRNNIFILYN